MITTILFDVDGTLIDTEEQMLLSLQKAVQDGLKQNIPKQDLQFILGIPGKDAVQQLTDDPIKQKLLLKLWNDNINEKSERVQVFDQIKETLYELKKEKYNLGIVTSKNNDEMKNEFDRFELNHFFDVVVTASDTKKHKPDSQPILKALEKFNVPKSEAVYIGDSIYDLQAAKNSGIWFGLAEWGAQKHHDYSSADFVISKPCNLLSEIKRISCRLTGEK